MVQRRNSGGDAPRRPGRPQTDRGASARDASSATPRAGRPRAEREAGKGSAASGRPSRTVHARPSRKAENGSRPHTTPSESRTSEGRSSRAAGTTGAQRAARPRTKAASSHTATPRERMHEGGASRTAPRARTAEAATTRPSTPRERSTETASRTTAPRGRAREARWCGSRSRCCAPGECSGGLSLPQRCALAEPCGWHRPRASAHGEWRCAKRLLSCAGERHAAPPSSQRRGSCGPRLCGSQMGWYAGASRSRPCGSDGRAPCAKGGRMRRSPSPLPFPHGGDRRGASPKRRRGHWHRDRSAGDRDGAERRRPSSYAAP